MVNREAFVLTYVLAPYRAFRACMPTGLLEWAFWSYADLDQPSEMSAAREAVAWPTGSCSVRQHDGLPVARPTLDRKLLSQEREAPAVVGFFALTGDEANSRASPGASTQIGPETLTEHLWPFGIIYGSKQCGKGAHAPAKDQIDL